MAKEGLDVEAAKQTKCCQASGTDWTWEQGFVSCEVLALGEKMTWVEISTSGGGTGLGGNVDLFKRVDSEIWSDGPVSVLDEAEARRSRLGRARVVEASGDCG